jgi:hypothetical protein
MFVICALLAPGYGRLHGLGIPLHWLGPHVRAHVPWVDFRCDTNDQWRR